MALYVTTRPVYEHSQDDGPFCGRACAQMVISSLIQGPPTGSPPTSADEAALIPVTQVELREREQFKFDDTRNESWFTHPDELLLLMKSAPELANGLSNWRLAVKDDVDGIYAELILALQGGMPALLNVYSSDHWVVIVGVGVDDATSTLNYMMVLDPLPQQKGVTHTYIDSCRQEGLTYVDAVVDPQHEVELAGLQLEIKNTPSPPGLTHYAGKFVALVYGPPFDRGLADKFSKSRRPPVPPYVWRPQAPLRATVGITSVDAMRQALQSRAQNWEIARLSELLASPHEHVARIVYDVGNVLAPYFLLSLFSPVLGYGVVGAFRVRDHHPLHFRFTRNRKFDQSLGANLDEPLWWTRKWLPSLKSPYFPFARHVVPNKHIYRRLFDDYIFELDA